MVEPGVGLPANTSTLLAPDTRRMRLASQTKTYVVRPIELLPKVKVAIPLGFLNSALEPIPSPYPPLPERGFPAIEVTTKFDAELWGWTPRKKRERRRRHWGLITNAVQ